MLIDILQLLIYGIVLGSIIALGAIGVSLTFGILGFANFSHGDLMTSGAYIAFTVYTILALPLWLAFPAAILGSIAVALVVDWAFYSRLRRSRGLILLISSFGVALIIRSLVQIVWGPDNQVYESGIQMAVRFGTDVVGPPGLRIKPDQIRILVGAVILVSAVHVFLRYTRMGKAMRAMADNPDLARLTGIDTGRVIIWTWVIGAGLAGSAGVFLGLDTRLHPDMGWFILLPIFAATILGGIGKPYGAIAGGLVIGIAQELSTLPIPPDYEPLVNPAYKPAVAFAIMVLMLIVRPTGLFAGRSL